MMNRAEIQKFFLLENDPQLFETALRPPSCGGGAEFEQLALYGDQVINIHLYKYLISKGLERKGDITPCKTTIHHWTVIKAFADDLGIPDILTPLDSTYHPKDKDLAETVEALIGAAFQVNGLENCYPIIFMFAKFAQKIQKTSQKQGEFDTSKNYKGKLFELFQKKGLNLPDIDVTRIGGADHSPYFQFKENIQSSILQLAYQHHKKKRCILQHPSIMKNLFSVNLLPITNQWKWTRTPVNCW
jgi:dsRNA-specific ribonuclease